MWTALGLREARPLSSFFFSANDRTDQLVLDCKSDDVAELRILRAEFLPHC